MKNFRTALSFMAVICLAAPSYALTPEGVEPLSPEQVLKQEQSKSSKVNEQVVLPEQVPLKSAGAQEKSVEVSQIPSEINTQAKSIIAQHTDASGKIDIDALTKYADYKIPSAGQGYLLKAAIIENLVKPQTLLGIKIGSDTAQAEEVLSKWQGLEFLAWFVANNVSGEKALVKAAETTINSNWPDAMYPEARIAIGKNTSRNGVVDYQALATIMDKGSSLQFLERVATILRSNSWSADEGKKLINQMYNLELLKTWQTDGNEVYAHQPMINNAIDARVMALSEPQQEVAFTNDAAMKEAATNKIKENTNDNGNINTHTLAGSLDRIADTPTGFLFKAEVLDQLTVTQKSWIFFTKTDTSKVEAVIKQTNDVAFLAWYAKNNISGNKELSALAEDRAFKKSMTSNYVMAEYVIGRNTMADGTVDYPGLAAYAMNLFKENETPRFIQQVINELNTMKVQGATAKLIGAMDSKSVEFLRKSDLYKNPAAKEAIDARIAELASKTVVTFKEPRQMEEVAANLIKKNTNANGVLNVDTLASDLDRIVNTTDGLKFKAAVVNKLIATKKTWIFFTKNDTEKAGLLLGKIQDVTFLAWFPKVAGDKDLGAKSNDRAFKLSMTSDYRMAEYAIGKNMSAAGEIDFKNLSTVAATAYTEQATPRFVGIMIRTLTGQRVENAASKLISGMDANTVTLLKNSDIYKTMPDVKAAVDSRLKELGI